MSDNGYQIRNQNAIHFVTFSVVEWVDVFTRSVYKRNENYQFWQQENHPIECSSSDILESKIKYLHENPVRAGIVRNEWEYVYSSGIDYYSKEKGLLMIDYLN